MSKEYSDKEKELIEYYKSIPKFRLSIGDLERALKVPLELSIKIDNTTKLNMWRDWLYTRKWEKNNTKEEEYNFPVIQFMKDDNLTYICNRVRLERYAYSEYSIENGRLEPDIIEVAIFGYPVREAKGKYLKRMWLKYFH